MKKTIIALLALGGVAMAEEPVSLGATYDLNQNWEMVLTVGPFDPNGAAPDFTTGDYYGTTELLLSDVLSINTFSQTSGLNIRNADMSIMTGVDGDFANIDWTLGGQFGTEPATKAMLTQITLTYNQDAKTLAVSAKAMMGQLSVDYLPTTEIAGVSFAAGATLSEVTTYIAGSTVAFDGVTVSSGGDNPSVPLSVPEPTTATLSMLALAGLVARRRRK